MSLCRLGCLPATVLYLCLLTVSKLQFRQRVEGLRTQGFWLPELGFRWCLASDPWPTSLIFVPVQVRLLTCYGPLPLPFNGFEAAVSAACGRVANAGFLVA